MKRPRQSPVFTAVLTACGLLALAEGYGIYERYTASVAAEKKLKQKLGELQQMGDLNPAPTRTNAAAIEADLDRAKRALAAMQTELSGRGPAADRLHNTRVPAARTDAFFDLATYMEKMRALAHAQDVDVRPEANAFGFGVYTHAGPVAGRIAEVFHQRQIAQYLVESLVEAHPRSIFAVQREHALTKPEKDARDLAALTAAAQAAGTPAPDAPPAPDNPPPPVETEPEGADFFEMDPRASARAPGYIDTTAFRLVFTGQTTALRAFLNKLASFELPVLVREVNVDIASPEEAAVATPAEDASAAEAASAAAANVPASVVLTTTPSGKPAVAAASSGKAAARPASRVTPPTPIVARPLSKFTVTVEFIDLVPSAAATAAAAAPADPGAPAPAPATPPTEANPAAPAPAKPGE